MRHHLHCVEDGGDTNRLTGLLGEAILGDLNLGLPTPVALGGYPV